MDELPKEGTREYALADALSRQFAMNGLYKKLRLPLDYEDLSEKDPLTITHLVDLADRIIHQAIASGEDLDNPKTQEKIQASVYGGAAGASSALAYHKFLRFFGIRK